MDYRDRDGFRYFEDGTIYDLQREMPVKFYKTYSGYLLAQMKINGKWVRKNAHRMIAISWHGQPTNIKFEVDHINNIRDDNRPSNLRWVSKSINNQKTWDIGNKVASGVHNGRCKRNPCDIHNACLLLEEGVSQNLVSKLTGIPKASINNIKRRTNWKIISDMYSF